MQPKRRGQIKTIRVRQACICPLQPLAIISLEGNKSVFQKAGGLRRLIHRSHHHVLSDLQGTHRAIECVQLVFFRRPAGGKREEVGGEEGLRGGVVGGGCSWYCQCWCGVACCGVAFVFAPFLFFSSLHHVPSAIHLPLGLSFFFCACPPSLPSLHQLLLQKLARVRRRERGKKCLASVSRPRCSFGRHGLG